jgi:uncharacterized membrane protein YkgB
MSMATTHKPATGQTEPGINLAEKEHTMALSAQTPSAAIHTVPSRALSLTIQTIGIHLVRYGLVLVLAWIGAMKFTAYEANGIQPLVANSPFMGWVYHVLSTQAFSNVLGLVLLVIAIMIALRPVSVTVGAVGSGAAVVMFLTTLSFLVSTPDWEPSLGGFPALSVVPGQFLLKDVVLLGAALWSLGEALQQIERTRQ